MIERYHFPKCHLNVGKYKTINSSLHLEIKMSMADEYGTQEHDDVKSTGELAFDSWPVDVNHPVKINAIGQVTAFDGRDFSKFNVMFVKKNAEQTLNKDGSIVKLKRYFWLVYVIGRPTFDGLEIFPEWYRGKLVNKVFTCTDFRGLWPIGVSSVVVARDKVEGKQILTDALRAAGIDQPEVEDLTLQELDITHTGVVVLNTGSY